MRKTRLPFVLAVALALAACGTPSTGPSSLPPGPDNTPANPPPPPPQAPRTARYRVTFASTWSATTHPTDFPDTAHYSGLIGGTHRTGTVFWQEGALASEGIRQMAERGQKSPLDAEVQQAIAAGGAEHLLSGPDLDDTPGSATMEFDISQGHALVTLVTMVAPSPDWFVGVSGLPLFDQNGWRDEVRVELAGFDAGTDSGTSYRSANRETVPHQPIQKLLGYPVEHGGVVRPFGTFTFTRLP